MAFVRGNAAIRDHVVTGKDMLLGIGIALLLERFHDRSYTTGLGLGGAISINLCGGLVLAIWLLAGNVSLPLRGSIVLWALVIVLIVLSSFELWAQLKQRQEGHSG